MKRILALILIVLNILIVCPLSGYAVGSGYPFTVEVIPPEGSIDYVGYYHVRGTPKGTITLQANITNITDRTIELKAVPMNAYSGPDGIFYQSPGEVNSGMYSLVDEEYGLAQYMNASGPYTLQPGETQTAQVVVNVPDINTGTLLGSIRFVYFAGTREMRSPSGGDNESTILIDKYQAIDTAIEIDLGGQAQPSVAAGTPSITKDGMNLLVPVSNRSALIEENVSVEYGIRDSQGNSLLNGNVSSSKMAPMSTFNLVIPLKDAVLGSGSYTLYAAANGSGESAVVNTPFTAGGAPPVNSVSVPSGDLVSPAENMPKAAPQYTLKPWLIIILSFIALCLAVFIFITYKRNKKPRGRHAYSRRRQSAV